MMETPQVPDPNEPDGLYGDEESLEQSCNAGAEQLQFLLKSTEAQAWLSRYTGPTEAAPREPEQLEDLEPDDES